MLQVATSKAVLGLGVAMNVLGIEPGYALQQRLDIAERTVTGIDHKTIWISGWKFDGNGPMYQVSVHADKASGYDVCCRYADSEPFVVHSTMSRTQAITFARNF